MGEGQMFIDPVAALEMLMRKLARGKHHLPVVAVDDVAVVVDIDKFIIGADFLELTVAGEDASASGFVTLTELKTEAQIDPKTFTFEPPAGATVMDLNQMALPTFEMPPQQ